MVWQQWVLCALYALVIIGSVLSIGDEREPLTKEKATAGLIVKALVIALIVTI